MNDSLNAFVLLIKCMNCILDHKPKRILIWKIYANLCRFDLRLNSFHWTKLLLWEAPNTSQNCWFLRVLRCPQTPAAMAMPPGQSLFHSHLSGLLHSGHCLFAVKGCCVRLHSHWLNSLFCCLHGHNTVKSYVVVGGGVNSKFLWVPFQNLGMVMKWRVNLKILISEPSGPPVHTPWSFRKISRNRVFAPFSTIFRAII